MNKPILTLQLLYAAGLLLLVGAAWLSRKGSLRQEMKNATLWVFIVTILLFGWVLFH